MHRFARRARRPSAPVPALVCAFAALGAWLAPELAAAGTVRLRLFNLPPNSPYHVFKNTSAVKTQASSLAGSIAINIEVSTGDRLALVPDLNMQPPPPPLAVSAELVTANCVRLTWHPSGDPTVVGYTISFGFRSVALGQATRYDESVDAGPLTAHTICALGPGRYYFAVQARNYAGQLSAYSAERMVMVSTVPVLISSFSARAGEGGVNLSWRVTTDEVIRGFVVYRRQAQAPERPLFDDPLPPDAVSYRDETTRSATAYTYTLAAVRDDGTEVRSTPANVTTPALALSLGPNVPNPFNASTRISFTLARSTRVVLQVYDVRGARVATLVDDARPEGQHSVEWNGVDEQGRRVASGTYFCKLTAGKETVSQKLSILR
jgi:hypothetical protein